MISKHLPGFCFVDPTNKETINIRFASVNVGAETRRIRAVWNPELVQDLQTFQNIDAEAELTALLAENLRNDIDQQILLDLQDNQRFYQHNNFNNALDRWNQIWGNVLIHHGHRAPQDNQPPDFGNIVLPMVRRVAAQTIGLDLVTVQPLEAPRGILEFLNYNQYFTDQDYGVLQNEEGWFTNGTFESLMIKMDMRPFHFILPRHLRNRRRRNDIRNLTGL